MNSLYKYICNILVIIFLCVCLSCNKSTNSCESNCQNECSTNELNFISILDSIEIDSIIIEYDLNRFGEFFKFELSRSYSFMVGHDYNPMVFNKKMTIKEAQEAVDQWIKTYGVRYFSELTNMAVLTEEVGELARVIARKYGDQSFKAGEKENLGDEMADVLWVLLCLANQTGIDLTEELKKNIAKKTERDKQRHIQNEKLK